MIKLLDFYADWCLPCKKLEPTIKDIEHTIDYVTIEKIDVDTDDERIEQYAIRSVPTILILKDDKLVDKLVGVVSKVKLMETINKYK